MNQKLHDEIYKIMEANKKPRAYVKITQLIDRLTKGLCDNCKERLKDES